MARICINIGDKPTSALRPVRTIGVQKSVRFDERINFHRCRFFGAIREIDPLTSKVNIPSPRAACQRPGFCLLSHGSPRLPPTDVFRRLGGDSAGLTTSGDTLRRFFGDQSSFSAFRLFAFCAPVTFRFDADADGAAEVHHARPASLAFQFVERAKPNAVAHAEFRNGECLPFGPCSFGIASIN
jgi:hypothetical protein